MTLLVIRAIQFLTRGLICVGATQWVAPTKNTLFVAQAQTFGNCQISLVIDFAKVSQQAAALSDHFEKSTPARLILFIGAQVICQLLDAPRQNGDLDFG
jgi:hypothetical protein